MILADTSIWVAHLRQGNAALARLLRLDGVATHAFVIGELACGGIRNRNDFLSMVRALPALPKADDQEVLEFISRHQLMGRGLGLIDIHLLASSMLSGVALWTRDGKLGEAARQLGLAADIRGLQG